jgi:hypothetical protein
LILPPRSPDSQAAKTVVCRLKSGRRERNFRVQRPEAKSRRERLLTCAETGKPHQTTANIPAEPACLLTTTVSEVREDWMVGVIGIEPVTPF